MSGEGKPCNRDYLRMCLFFQPMQSISLGLWQHMPGRCMMCDVECKVPEAGLTVAMRYCAGRQGEEGAGAGLHRAAGHLHACAGASTHGLCAQCWPPLMSSLMSHAIACFSELQAWRVLS